MAWRKLAGLREADRLRPWLCTIAANEARRLAGRRRRAAVREISVDANPGAGARIHPDPAGRAQDLDLAAALGRLRPADRSLLALRYVAGLSSTELGRASGMSASGTRARLGRLLDRLRIELDDD
jgi:RNA polymerase sigma-70 factor (ECF subfamily)